MNAPRTALSLVVAIAFVGAFARAQAAETSCRVCHPGAVRALAATPHAMPATAADRPGMTCTSCHGDLTAHAAAAGRGDLTALPTPVVAAACAACHPGGSIDTARGAHPLRRVGSGMPAPATPDADRLARLQDAAADPSLTWSGLAEFGYRFVHHMGSRAGFDSDLDLDPGLRLREIELRGTGRGAAAVDEVTLRGHDLGDPRWGADATVAATDRFRLATSYREDHDLYAAGGDFHRVDRARRTLSSTIDVGDHDLTVFLRHRHDESDGFWLTQRIGDRNLPVQTVVDGVASPRQRRSDEAEIGLRSDAGLQWTIAGGFVDEAARDRWSFTQPATANPGFSEAEDLTSTSDAIGPTARVELAHAGDRGGFALRGHLRASHRDLDGDGTGAGFDTTAFTTTTTSRGTGASRWLEWSLDADRELVPTLRIAGTARLRDYHEELQLHQVLERTTTSPAAVVTTATDVDDETVQRLFDGDLRLEWSPTADLSASVGYGFAREQLRVPALAPADPADYRRGHTRDDGVLAALRWRFAPEWTLRLDGRDFDTDGLLLQETTAARARAAAAELSWRGTDAEAGCFVRHRHAANAISDHRLDALTCGCHASLTVAAITFGFGYSFADTESRTRTSFYFDPDPTPRPTIVGFAGETHVWNASASTDLTRDLQLVANGALTRTRGSFDVTTYDASAELRWQWTQRGAAELEVRRVSYADESGGSWAADLVFVGWRQTW